MSVRIHVTVCRTIAAPSSSEVVAASSLEVELDETLLSRHAEELHAQLQRAFVACERAVNDNLDAVNSEQRNP